MLLGVLGLPAAYGLDAMTFLLSALLVTRMAPMPAPSGAAGAKDDGPVPSWGDMGQGVRHVLADPVLIGTYLSDLIATVVALPFAMFPFLALALHAPWALGMFYAAGAVGSLAATAVSGWTGRTRHHGRWMLACSLVWSMTIIAVGVSSRVWLTFALLTVSGAAYFFADLFRTTIWNQTIPDQVRGRVAAVELLVGSSGPALGDLRAGLLAARLGFDPPSASAASSAFSRPAPYTWSPLRCGVTEE